MTIDHLQIKVHSPLHIGSGKAPLRRDIDFAAFGRFLYVLNLDAVLEHLLPDDANPELVASITEKQNLASFLTESELKKHPELFFYRLGGTTIVSEVRSYIKSGVMQPYLPGSSVKGAIRTALANSIAENRQLNLARATFGPRPEWAGREIEHGLFGRAPTPGQAPNYDLMRTLQVADSTPINADRLQLDNVAVWGAGQQGIPIDIETVREGSEFKLRVKIDEYLFSDHAKQLGFASDKQVITNWLGLCRTHGLAQLQQEAAFFRDRVPQIARFYDSLLDKAQNSSGCFLQIGWGTGWHSKTLSRLITPNRDLLNRIVQGYNLSRGRFSPDTPFPRTRHLIVDARRQPLMPLGWVEITISA